MKRKRFIVQTAKNGGKSCPPVRQVRGCSLDVCTKRSGKIYFHLFIFFLNFFGYAKIEFCLFKAKRPNLT